jgi:hypothetical protein
MKLSGLCVVVLFAVPFWGCASDQANRYYGNEKYASRPVEEVEILREPPTSEYEVIADFQSRGESPKDMQRKAAEIGADAVIVATVGGYRSKSDEWAGVDSQSSTYSRIVGTAIKFKEKAK